MNHIIEKYLIENHYARIKTPLEEVQVFYTTESSRIKTIIICQLKTPQVGEKYRSILFNMRSLFYSKGYADVEEITLFLTEELDDVKQFRVEDAPYWTVDLLQNRFIIYEDQPNDFYGLRTAVEQMVKERMEMGEGVHALLYKTKRFLKQRGAITLLLILANVLTFIVLECLGSTEDERFMFYHGAAFTPSILLSHEYYRLFTSMFLHFGIQHLFNNMVVLFFLGDVLEKQIGKTSFFLVYLLGGLGGNLLSLFVDVRTSQFAISAGASGAVFAIMGGLVFLLTVNKGKIPNISPRRFGIMVFLSLYQGFTSVGIDNYAHLGGLISGFFMTGLISFIHIKKQKKQQY